MDLSGSHAARGCPTIAAGEAMLDQLDQIGEKVVTATTKAAVAVGGGTAAYGAGVDAGWFSPDNIMVAVGIFTSVGTMIGSLAVSIWFRRRQLAILQAQADSTQCHRMDEQ